MTGITPNLIGRTKVAITATCEEIRRNITTTNGLEVAGVGRD